jgi:hypothetical protein
MMHTIPAPGFKPISGKRNPPFTSKGYWVQLATDIQGMGWIDKLAPWPINGPVWKWAADTPRPWEVVAVKPAD